MKSVAAVVVLLGMASFAAGCASGNAVVHGPAFAARGGATLASGPTPQDPNPRGGAVARGDGVGYGAVEGIPTPEPAVPVTREPRLASPTPQVPIPVHEGRPAVARY